MPGDNYFVGSDITPPLFKLLPRQVESGGRNQVIEDNRVLFAPTKPVQSLSGNRYRTNASQLDSPVRLLFSGP